MVAEPASDSEPVAIAEALSAAEPAETAEPAAPSGPAVALVPLVGVEPAVAAEPAGTRPVWTAEAVGVTQPAAAAEPAAPSEPAVALVPLVGVEPAVAAEPAGTGPVWAAEAVGVTQAAAAAEPAAPSGPAGAEPVRAAEGASATEPVTAAGAAVASESGQVGAAAVGSDVPDGVFKVRLANFEGPFDLLLQLISKHKLDVTEVALSKVTDEFMAHIRAMGPDWDLDQTTEFLVVAATLLDLKAARLLPRAEVEDEADLALLEARDLLFARLLQYRAYKRIADIFNERLAEEALRRPRTVGLEPEHAELLPEVVISIGPEGFAKLAVKAMQPRPKPQVYVDHIHAPLVSVQEQAGIVVARVRELGEVSFRVLVEDTDDTLTVVARFLALLELYREKAVALDQETALGELVVRWTGGDTDAAPRVTDEFDRPPEEPKEERKP
ncbi:segregation/condensation protein A [Streptomyces sp. NPDC014846]|uniref:segregation and condensation protein A n=1 Tax=Streptomyces sp. NPDC014846 TaxID=3364922 RepID=UPI003701E466